MRSMLFALTIVVAPAMGFANSNSVLEDELWAHAATAGSIQTLQLFIETFPEGRYIEEAKALAKVLEDDLRRREFEHALGAMVGDITFDRPLEFGNDRMIGSSIAQLIKSSPSFPPIPDLPESYWKEQSCSNCHNWTREDLCTQATIYTKSQPTKYQEKRHPFGGLFKVGLSIWAEGGCQ